MYSISHYWKLFMTLTGFVDDPDAKAVYEIF